MEFIKKNWLALLVVVLLVSFFIWFGYNQSTKSKTQAQINDIDKRLNSGKSSASDTVDLYARKTALIEQLKK